MINRTKTSELFPLRAVILLPLVWATMNSAAQARQAEKYIGDIFMTGASACPSGSKATDGQTLNVSEHQILYSLIGTKFGGDGRATFRLPDLRGRAPVGIGQGPGLMAVREGEIGGQERIALDPSRHLPAHTHEGDPSYSEDHSHPMTAHRHAGTVQASSQDRSESSPSQNSFPTYRTGLNLYASSVSDGEHMAEGTIRVSDFTDKKTQDTIPLSQTEVAGGGKPVELRSPFTAVHFCIVTDGIFPPRD